MNNTGRSLRRARLLKGGDTPLFFVPLDHTVTDGPFANARRYDALLGALADNGADAIIVHKGRLGLLPEWVYARLSVVVHISASTKYAPDPSFKYQVGSAEDCLRRGADAVSVHVNLGSPTEDQQIRMMAEVADSCDRVGLPLLAMLYPRGPGIQNHPLSQTLQQDMTHVVDSCSIPVLSAGGSQVSDDEFGIFVANAVKSGARGLAAGRNIFMAADPGKKVREIRQILIANCPKDLQHPTIAINRPIGNLAQPASS
jgi:2-amino-4,5-dihydroxy-6-oxo-7-(phosphonooxy)heptanoate synthase